MLTKEIKEALMGYTANMQNDVAFVVQIGEHEKRTELLQFLNEFAKVSPRLSVVERDQPQQLRSPISFMLEVDGRPSGILFSGIPAGHEFNSLVLAVLHASGTPSKMDEQVKGVVGAARRPLDFEVYVGLSCHNCPDVVQALNQFALLNGNISSEMIDGGLFPELVETKGIQGVPAVYLNGEVFANGKVDTARLLQKLLERYPDLREARSAESLPQQDVTVIGGGPAGVSAAIYAARKGLSVTVIADRLGGQVKDTMAIENLISVPSTTGPELAQALQTHLLEHEVSLREHFRVERVESGEVKRVHLSSGEVIETRALIVASGAKWRELGVPGERENIGNGVAYCPHCDGPFFKGRDVAVIGGGNSGIEAALDLAGIVRSVTVIEYLPELKADQVLLDKLRSVANIRVVTNAATRRIIATEGKVSSIEYQSRATGAVQQLALSGVFVQIGLVPNSDFLRDLVELTAHGEVVIDERGRTSEAGIFACGDVTTVPYKQIVVAMGEGAKAALAAFDYLLLRPQPVEQAA
ncbi:MAG: alkyl hydroperoxide reductase subunit F [Gammaproteobacteria bacterium]|nr:alkyl hydroperoxide reductase subunit F [Gammaproteobacteria bacterium]